MKAEAPAKINLLLEVGGRRPDGFHDLYSLVEPITLFDTLTILPADGICTIFDSPWPIDPLHNTVQKAILLLKQQCGVSSGIRVTVRKRIPAGAGLGGGSSDAAAILSALNRLWRLSLPREELCRIGAQVGSDVPLFFFNRRVIMEGRGDVVIPVARTPVFWYLLAIPPFQVSTERVYEQLDKRAGAGDLTSAVARSKLFRRAMRRKDLRIMESLMVNHLQEVTENTWNDIKLMRVALEAASGRKFLLSGSGGTLFAVFGTKRDAEATLPVLTLRGWAGVVVGTVS